MKRPFRWNDPFGVMTYLIWLPWLDFKSELHKHVKYQFYQTIFRPNDQISCNPLLPGLVGARKLERYANFASRVATKSPEKGAYYFQSTFVCPPSVHQHVLKCAWVVPPPSLLSGIVLERCREKKSIIPSQILDSHTSVSVGSCSPGVHAAATVYIIKIINFLVQIGDGSCSVQWRPSQRSRPFWSVEWYITFVPYCNTSLRRATTTTSTVTWWRSK